MTIPLKLNVLPLLDEVDEEARIVGAVNTIIPVSQPGTTKKKLFGRNTDWLGMMDCLRRAGASGHIGESMQAGLVIGGGGTARAAVQTLRSMNYSPIYLLGRNKAKVDDLARNFPSSYNLIVIDASKGPECALRKFASQPPQVAIGTIPANIPMDPALKAVLEAYFKSHQNEFDVPTVPHITASNVGTQGILLEMAYKPVHTELMKMAENIGKWKTIQGLETLVAQALWQYEFWTGIRVQGLALEKYRALILGAADPSAQVQPST